MIEMVHVISCNACICDLAGCVNCLKLPDNKINGRQVPSENLRDARFSVCKFVTIASIKVA
jgi:hypothetical protein